MIRTVFAMAVAALVLAAVSGTSQAAPIAPLPGARSIDAGNVTSVYYHYYHRHWRHCVWHRGYRRCW
jgi:hypothetical protein